MAKNTQSLCVLFLFDVPLKICPVAMAILGGYSFLIGIFKIKGAISKKPPTKEIAAAPATASSDGSAMPSSDSRKFLFVSIVKKNKK